jgi:O-acetyl-ADP-ribose deacetylase
MKTEDTGERTMSDSETSRIHFVLGDITAQTAGAIVNAANSTLLGGGGVDGAIHRVGGPAILDECRALRAATLPSGLPAGEAVATTAGNLRARRVIHTVGPVWRGGGHDEATVLARSYESVLQLAANEGLRTLAFPSISTGAYGYPTERAAAVALKTVGDFLARNRMPEAVTFVLFSKADYDIYTNTYDALRHT